MKKQQNKLSFHLTHIQTSLLSLKYHLNQKKKKKFEGNKQKLPLQQHNHEEPLLYLLFLQEIPNQILLNSPEPKEPAKHNRQITTLRNLYQISSLHCLLLPCKKGASDRREAPTGSLSSSKNCIFSGFCLFLIASQNLKSKTEQGSKQKSIYCLQYFIPIFNLHMHSTIHMCQVLVNPKWIFFPDDKCKLQKDYCTSTCHTPPLQFFTIISILTFSSVSSRIIAP